MKVLALDPGLQRTGWAVFAVPRPPRSFNDALKGLVAHGQVETSSSDPMHARLASIGLQVRNLLIIHDPALVYVEVPSFHGNYADDPGRRRGTIKLYQALGAILSRMDGVHVVSVSAIRQKKETRNDLLEAGAQIAKVELPYGARGGKTRSVGQLRHRFEAAAERAGLRGEGTVGLRLKDLRGTFATYHLRAGGDIRELQEILGHRRRETTLRYVKRLAVGGRSMSDAEAAQGLRILFLEEAAG